MFRIRGTTIECSRGDAGTIHLKLPITDVNNYIKYIDTSEKIYWYDSQENILYDSNYEIIEDVKIEDLTLVYYIFQIGDVLELKIYEKNGYDDKPLMIKAITVSKEGESVDIPLTKHDTTFGKPANKEIIYWYDITLNDDLTIICFDENGAKEFIQYPAKGVDE